MATLEDVLQEAWNALLKTESDVEEVKDNSEEASACLGLLKELMEKNSKKGRDYIIEFNKHPTLFWEVIFTNEVDNFKRWADASEVWDYAKLICNIQTDYTVFKARHHGKYVFDDEEITPAALSWIRAAWKTEKEDSKWKLHCLAKAKFCEQVLWSDER